MNAEKLKKDLSRAIEMAQTIHDGMVDVLVAVGPDNDTGALVLEAVSGIATLKWYLEHISEGVSA